ncbi:hypothetical protein FGU71_08330 [Erythrobacter insulae]|uniref:LysR family transcriptional regulator n=1 Tax=Erythrobacter insulae TaxID=2584124 RepID=A0A547PCK3_9SPHN|nr:hypothetical protein [Erythrobacter insulae]TRD11860.1 hypothetical protein FGU71_08330 [Erythrobacter insulae]
MAHTPETLPAAASFGTLTALSEPKSWTPERQSAFLTALASSHSVAQAARIVGMSRQSAYALRARLKGEPFDLAWHAALRCRFDALAEAALERALHGVEVPHFHQGELIHTSRRFDERLTVALLAMRDSLGPPRVPSHHAAAGYGAEDFGPLVSRVADGPETWDEESRLEYEAFYHQHGPEEGDEYEDDDEDEGGEREREGD